ncbi:MAG: glycerate kinase [Leifsonia sp.]
MARVVIAPDSFKGTIGAADAAKALAAGWHSVAPDDDLRLVPLADGGEGTIDAFELAVPGARRMPVTVDGPDGRPVETAWLLLPPTGGQPATGVVELASTSGITLLHPLLPYDAHTIGFGQAIAAALSAGVDRLLLAIGGSSSTDGGAGALTALGARLTDADGRAVPPGNRGLAAVAGLDVSGLAALPPGGAVILSDVTNPLLGPLGAAAVFGRQKGAGASDIAPLDAALARWAGVVARGGSTADPSTPGSGAAGGTGFGLLAWGARLVPGSDAVGAALGLPDALLGAALAITGEGRFDDQSLAGKVPGHVLAATGGAVPVALVAGAIDGDTTSFASAVSLTGLAGGASAARSDPARWLREAGALLAAR